MSAECTTAETPWCNPETQACEAAPAGGAIGWGDGSQESVTLTLINGPSNTLEATGLEFNPERPNELWVVQRFPISTAPCTEQQPTAEGCGALEGRITIITDPGTEESSATTKNDGNSWHFMRRPSGIAFGENQTFATSGEERSGNFLDDSVDYMGPTLWSSDLGVFAQDPGVDERGQPLNGSHLDMLHATPWGVGIAHEKGNAYWTFNGDIGALDRYDFNVDHGPGYHDHSDGELARYVVGELERVANIPSGMVFDKANGMLYVSDTGHGRVVKLDPTSGQLDGEAAPVYEVLASNTQYSGASLTDVVPPGVIVQPSGLALHEGVLYIADNGTGILHAFDLEGNSLRTLQTPLTDGSLGGITVGPDGKLYLASLLNSTILRIDPM